MERIINLKSGETVTVEDEHIGHFGPQTVLASRDEEVITLYFEEEIPMVDEEKKGFLSRLIYKSEVMRKKLSVIEYIFSGPLKDGPEVWMGVKLKFV